MGYLDGRGTASAAADYSFRVTVVQPGRHVFRLKQASNRLTATGTYFIRCSVEEDLALPDAFVLTAPYPNPINAPPTFQFAVAREQAVSVILDDALGRRVAVLYDGPASANEMQTVYIDGHRLTSGTYFVRMTTGSHAELRQLILLK